MTTVADRLKAVFGSGWHVNSDAIIAQLETEIESGGDAPVVVSLTGSAATLPITGLAAAQGGSVSVTGGASSTTGNAGGAANLVGGAPGATGVGGAANVTGAAGGSTS